MELVGEQRGEILVVHAMQDRIDAACAVQFKDRMRELTQMPLPRVVLDMSQGSRLKCTSPFSNACTVQ